MNELVLANRAVDWSRLKALVLDSVSSPIKKRVYNLGLDEFFAWYGKEPRPGFTKATVAAWRVALEARGLGAVSVNVRITAVRKLAVEAADNGLLAPELANGITRVRGVSSKGVRLGSWLSLRQAQALLNAADIATNKGLRDRSILAVLLSCGLRRSEGAALTVGHIQQRDGRWCIVDLVGKHGRVRTNSSVPQETYSLEKGHAGACSLSLRSTWAQRGAMALQGWRGDPEPAAASRDGLRSPAATQPGCGSPAGAAVEMVGAAQQNRGWTAGRFGPAAAPARMRRRAAWRDGGVERLWREAPGGQYEQSWRSCTVHGKTRQLVASPACRLQWPNGPIETYSRVLA